MLLSNIIKSKYLIFDRSKIIVPKDPEPVQRRQILTDLVMPKEKLYEIYNQREDILKEAKEQKEAMLKEAGEQKETMLQEAGEQKEAMLKEANEQREAILNEADRQKEALLKEADEQREAMLKEAEEQRDAVLKEADDKKEAIMREADEQSRSLLQEAADKKEAMLREAAEQREAMLNEAKEEASRIIETAKVNAQAEIEECRKRANEEGYAQGHASGMKAGKDKGYSEGYETGRQDATEELRRQNSSKIEEMVQMMKAIEDEKDGIIERYKEGLTKLSVDIAEKIVRHKLQMTPDVISKIIEGVVKDYKNVEWIRVYISDEDDVKFVKSDKELNNLLGNISKDVKIEASDKLAKGSVKVETPDGIVDAGIGTQFNNLKEMVLNKNGI